MKSGRILSIILGLILAVLPAQSASAQNPFGGNLRDLGEQVKEKAFIKAVSAMLNTQLPIKLDATTAFPTVDTLPGDSFAPRTVNFTVESLNKPLAPGDYTFTVTAFCTEYSMHRPGRGVAYKLAPLLGKESSAVATLLWRGIQARVPPRHLMGVAWGMQSGLTYLEMPHSFQQTIDQLIPDYKSQLNGDFIRQVEDIYQTYSKGTKLPPLDQLISKMGGAGKVILVAKHQREALLAQGTTDEIREQTLFAGQESGVYAPVQAEVGPWTVRIPGVAFMRYKIEDGNLGTNNIMEIRILPGDEAQRPTILSLMGAQLSADGKLNATGLIGYSQGQGAQALIPVTSGRLLAPAQPRILLAGNDITYASQTVVVGAKIDLSVDNNGLPVQSTTWTVPGTTVGGYTPTASSFASAEVLPTDFTKPATTFYWIDQAKARTVTLAYTLSNGTSGTVETTFNVAGPTAPSMTVHMGSIEVGPLKFTGGSIRKAAAAAKEGLFLGDLAPQGAIFQPYSPAIDWKEIGIEFQGSVTQSDEISGTLSFVQIATIEEVVKGLHPNTRASQGALDNKYPYDSTPLANGLYSNDTPVLFLQTGNTSVSTSQNYSTYLMWTPTIAQAIPVPLGVVTWEWSGMARYSAAAKGWKVLESPEPVAKFTPFKAQLTYPAWTQVLTTTAPK